MRKLSDHRVNGCNERIEIAVLDKKGSGGAHHEYDIVVDEGRKVKNTIISFQDGPIKECGVNGVTHEALIAICIDRLKCFQSGPYSCRENALALTKLEEAMHWLNSRTNERLARDVEGTHDL